MSNPKSVVEVMDGLVAAGLAATVDGLIAFTGNMHHKVAPAVIAVAEANDWLDGEGELTQLIADAIKAWAVIRGLRVGRS
jgi:hypothetical protein